jgi:hypothetical protein
MKGWRIKRRNKCHGCIPFGIVQFFEIMTCLGGLQGTLEALFLANNAAM